MGQFLGRACLLVPFVVVLVGHYCNKMSHVEYNHIPFTIQYQPFTHYQMTNFILFQTERIYTDNNFKFDENGSKLSKWVENTVGQGEIACYEQFLIFPQCFQKACFPGASKGVIVWEWVKINSLPHKPWFLHV